ncbi:hypothetical protein [Parvimonas micra]|uniref:Uncharacterized protein n=1 Tax=Parvimonas micra ATCC 33270 TaxID=411465 RepID=A8SKR1_9FIRM|nr:hypothetical protein [Parvimonas micra]EDP24173.1 hypothetical protein PEPMIC_00753 [Parvimonas micra ATCC 33270]VEH96965.1 Uncharacterised protein [Parvimonas micra]
MKRKGYKNIEQQLAADKRYLENNFQAKQRRKVIVAKSSCKRFINELANINELEELENIIKTRKEFLNMNNVISILKNVEYGRLGNLTEDDRYDFCINWEEVTEEEKEQIENFICENGTDKDIFSNEEYQDGINCLYITITEKMLQSLIKFFDNKK